MAEKEPKRTTEEAEHTEIVVACAARYVSVCSVYSVVIIGGKIDQAIATAIGLSLGGIGT